MYGYQESYSQSILYFKKRDGTPFEWNQTRNVNNAGFIDLIMLQKDEGAIFAKTLRKFMTKRAEKLLR